MMSKRHAGRRPEITRAVYNSVRKYDRQSFEAWADNLYRCGFEDGSSQETTAGYDKGYKQGFRDAIGRANSIAATIKGIGAKRLAELSAALDGEVE